MLRKLFVVLPFVLGMVNFANGASKSEATNSNLKKGYAYCGESGEATRSRARRVIGGNESVAHAWPWMVLILNYTNVNCAGSIISPTVVITAAHCVDGKNKTSLSFYAGKHEVGKDEPHQQKLEVRNIYIHEKYKKGNYTDTGEYDIAFVHLKNPLTFSEYVRPICLSDKNRFRPGDVCVLSGWGYTSAQERKTATKLQDVKLPLVSNKVCNSNKSYGGRIRKGYFCAGLAEGGKDGCRYDSGGPLMCSRDKSAPWYLVGIMTWGEGCAGKDKYGVYTNVTTHMDTIRARVKDLPQPANDTPAPAETRTQTNEGDEANKDKIFIAIIAALSFIILILITTLCIVNFYTRGYICCTATEKCPSRKHIAHTVLHEQNGKLNTEASV